MALKINVLLLTTDLETIYQAPAGIEASVHGLVFSNNTANTETFNLIFYENSTNSAFHLAEDFEISPKTVYTWPVPINMEPGDYLESSSSSNDAITVSASYFEGSKKIAKGFTPRGIWDENASYDINDIVIFEGEVFAATEETTGIDPTESNSGWILFIPEISQGTVEVSNIRTPVITSPAGSATDVLSQPTIEGTEYAPLYSVDTRDYRQLQIDVTAGDFSNPIIDQQENADDITVSTPLTVSTTYKARIRDVATTGAVSDWSDEVSFTTPSVFIDEPTLTVTGSPNDVPETPTMTTSAFATTPAASDTHLNTDWQVLDDQLNVVFESLADAVNKLSIVVPADLLDEDTTYTFRARHRGTTFGASPFATVVATTMDPFFLQATGGTVTDITDNGLNYRVHTFTNDGDFEVTRDGEVEYLIVAGGGGGGGNGSFNRPRASGGGGAGGLLKGQTLVEPNLIPIVVGPGGAGTNNGTGINGSDSSFGSVVAIGGGGGGGQGGSVTGAAQNGNDGGSGGGAGRQAAARAKGTAGQGNDGGINNQDDFGNGGGGAGGVGGDGTPPKAGDGGAGLSSDITGDSIFYAGGGAGAAEDSTTAHGNGGIGGGGNAGQNGTANTGGGGGGGGGVLNSGSGGSGIVIVRYRIG